MFLFQGCISVHLVPSSAFSNRIRVFNWFCWTKINIIGYFVKLDLRLILLQNSYFNKKYRVFSINNFYNCTTAVKTCVLFHNCIKRLQIRTKNTSFSSFNNSFFSVTKFKAETLCLKRKMSCTAVVKQHIRRITSFL